MCRTLRGVDDVTAHVIYFVRETAQFEAAWVGRSKSQARTFYFVVFCKYQGGTGTISCLCVTSIQHLKCSWMDSRWLIAWTHHWCFTLLCMQQSRSKFLARQQYFKFTWTCKGKNNMVKLTTISPGYPRRKLGLH